jgi:hypothetical protein
VERQHGLQNPQRAHSSLRHAPIVVMLLCAVLRLSLFHVSPPHQQLQRTHHHRAATIRLHLPGHGC